MNPTDAFRKEQRKREIQRNKLERKYLRDANSKKETPEELRNELKDLISKEQNGGPLTKMERLRKRVLQDAYDAALKKRKVRPLRSVVVLSKQPKLYNFQWAIFWPVYTECSKSRSGS